MNKVQFVSRVYHTLRDNNIRKSIPLKKAVFHISDDDGNVADFSIRQDNKRVLFTTEDITNIIDACVVVVADALKHGEDVSVRGFGTIGVRKRAARAVKKFGTEEWCEAVGGYVPKFTFGDTLKIAARLYDTTQEGSDAPELPIQMCEEAE